MVSNGECPIFANGCLQIYTDIVKCCYSNVNILNIINVNMKLLYLLTNNQMKAISWQIATNVMPSNFSSISYKAIKNIVLFNKNSR